jgi:hypothetical protein
MQHTPPNRPDPWHPAHWHCCAACRARSGCRSAAAPRRCASRWPWPTCWRAPPTPLPTPPQLPPARAARLATLAAAIEGDAVTRQAMAAGPSRLPHCSKTRTNAGPDARCCPSAWPGWRAAARRRAPTSAPCCATSRGPGAGYRALWRFENPPAPAHPARWPAPPSWNDYTWLVAGCVGEFWTACALRHLPGFAACLMQEACCALGRRYGRACSSSTSCATPGRRPGRGALLPAGRRSGRRRHSPATSAGLPGGRTPCTATGWRQRRATWPRACAMWMRSTTGACAPPAPCPRCWALRTLALLRRSRPWRTACQRVKVPRSEVRT